MPFFLKMYFSGMIICTLFCGCELFKSEHRFQLRLWIQHLYDLCSMSALIFLSCVYFYPALREYADPVCAAGCLLIILATDFWFSVFAVQGDFGYNTDECSDFVLNLSQSIAVALMAPAYILSSLSCEVLAHG